MQEIDYETDIQNLQQVWKESPKATAAATRGTQAKINHQKQEVKKVSSSKNKKSVPKKVVVSNKHMHRQAINNEQVVAVSTHPQQFKNTHTDFLRKELNNDKLGNVIIAARSRSDIVDLDKLQRQIDEKDKEIAVLRVMNSALEDRVRRIQSQSDGKDKVIESLRTRERELLNQASSLVSKEINFNYGKVQYENYRADSRRLLKMLQATAEYKYFAEFALQDNGVRFLHDAKKKTKLDVEVNGAHYCACNQQFIPQQNLWVPDQVYMHGKEFLKERNGQLTAAELQLLLYELNRIWREREKKITNSLNALNAHDVAKFKRKIQHLTKEEHQQ